MSTLDITELKRLRAALLRVYDITANRPDVREIARAALATSPGEPQKHDRVYCICGREHARVPGEPAPEPKESWEERYTRETYPDRPATPEPQATAEYLPAGQIRANSEFGHLSHGHAGEWKRCQHASCRSDREFLNGPARPTTPEPPPVPRATDDQRLINALAWLYRQEPPAWRPPYGLVAELCDEYLDRSGALLGKVRDAARLATAPGEPPTT